MSISKNELKKISSLNRKSKRKEHGLFIVEGEKNCKELEKAIQKNNGVLKLSKLNKGFPAALSDQQKNIYGIKGVSIRSKKERPTVGFCGQATSSKIVLAYQIIKNQNLNFQNDLLKFLQL